MDMQTARRGRRSGSPAIHPGHGRRQAGEETFSAVLRRLMKARRMSAPRLADRSCLPKSRQVFRSTSYLSYGLPRLDSAYVWRQPPALWSPTWKLRALRPPAIKDWTPIL